jgi:hypothetical protein
VNNEQLLRLYLQTFEAGGTLPGLIRNYRELTDSTATDESLRSWLSKRINQIRRDAAHVYGQERALLMVPRLRTPKRKARSLDHALEYIIDRFIRDQIL